MDFSIGGGPCPDNDKKNCQLLASGFDNFNSRNTMESNKRRKVEADAPPGSLPKKSKKDRTDKKEKPVVPARATESPSPQPEAPALAPSPVNAEPAEEVVTKSFKDLVLHVVLICLMLTNRFPGDYRIIM